VFKKYCRGRNAQTIFFDNSFFSNNDDDDDAEMNQMVANSTTNEGEIPCVRLESSVKKVFKLSQHSKLK